MATNMSYQHKKFDIKTEEYTHKKFGIHSKKRQLETEEEKENIPQITAQTILDLAKKETENQQPPAKRRQTKPLFRPWLDESNQKEEPKQNVPTPSSVLSNVSSNILTYHPNMARHHHAKPRSELEQQKRKRNNLACLINRRNKLAEQLMLQQQYAAYQQHKAVIMEQNVRTALYLRHLQQLALQRQQLPQQQLFVFGQK